RNPDIAFLDRTGLGIHDAIPLPLGVDGLALEDYHPQLALVELAAPLHRLEQLLVVQVAFAEVPPDQRAGDDFTLAQAVVGLVGVVSQSAGNQPVERAPVSVHGP